MEPQTFAIEQDESGGPDVYVAEVFTDRWDTRRAILDGETYEAKETIKFDWETTHHEFDSTYKAWIVDEDSLEELADRLEEEGFSFGRQHDEMPAPADFVAAAEFAEIDDRIEVTYMKKTGTGTSTFAGRVIVSDADSVKADGRAYIAFKRDKDGHRMRVKTDRNGKTALFTAGSHAPFVGQVEEILVEPVSHDEVEA